jgi:hypothetical protein
MTDIFQGLGVPIKLINPEDFLKIKETLTRIGIASNKDKTLYQSCHILHKQGQYAVFHFKEMFLLDGKPSNFSEEDLSRRNTIANLLHDWELYDLVDEKNSATPVAPLSQIKILKNGEKKDWKLVAKYTVGKKRQTIED